MRPEVLAVSFGIVTELVASSASAWGPVGHETIAAIAEDNLSRAAKRNLAVILGVHRRLADIATWADEIRPRRPETARWHYVNIDDRAALTEADEPRFCANHDCVVDQIDADIAVLKGSAGIRKKREALEFLVHFVGDVHQPLHCADDGDRGGNDKFVRFVAPGSRSKRGAKVRLHVLWDHLIELRPVESPLEFATALEQKITDAQRVQWARGTPVDWAWESYTIAHDQIYGGFRTGPTDRSAVALPPEYGPKMRAIVEMQLERAGIRLAMILNDVLGK